MSIGALSYIDPHDVFELKVAGRKLWRVDVESGRPPSERDPQRHQLVEPIVTPGDMLYLPRGWWHSATPMDEPTIHLAFGVSRPSRVDLVAWVARTPDRGRSLSAEVPALAGRAEKEAFLADLRGRLRSSA